MLAFFFFFLPAQLHFSAILRHMDTQGVLKLMAEAKERELTLMAEAHAARERALQGELEAAKREAAVREEAGAAGGGPAPLRQRLPGGSWRWSSARAP